MTHVRQHAGFATQAKRRGEQLVMCNTCGQRAHPRLVVRQAIHADPRRAVWPRYAVAVAGLVAFLALIAQAAPV